MLIENDETCFKKEVFYTFLRVTSNLCIKMTKNENDRYQ